MNKKGFTMLELLIAAAIIGILAVLATRSFRGTMGETYIQDGKNRVRAVATAVQRFKMDYPSYNFAGGTELVSGKSTCATNVTPKTSQVLINCNYLDDRPWTDSHVSIEVCGSSSSAQCGKASLSDRLVCMTGRDSKFATYNGKDAYVYCESATQKQECFGSSCTTTAL